MTALPTNPAVEALFSGTARETADPKRPGLSDQELIVLATEGCQESFRLLVERYQEAVYGFCFRWSVCPDDAQEVCQDVFVKAYRALPRYRPRAQFTTWLFKIALNLCRDRARARSARKRPAFDSREAANEAGGGLACPCPGPDECLSQTEELGRLQRGIELLPRRLQEALVLVAVEGHTHEECAEVLSCSVRAVEGRLYRARRQLLQWWNCAD